MVLLGCMQAKAPGVAELEFVAVHRTKIQAGAVGAPERALSVLALELGQRRQPRRSQRGHLWWQPCPYETRDTGCCQGTNAADLCQCQI